MRSPGLLSPLRRPAFRRLAVSYAVNELGDWMGIVALSVLVFDRTGSAYASAALFLGIGFLPAMAAPILVARAEVPPPRYALPVIYCGEAAAFGGLALLASHFSLAGVVVLATVDGALALAGRALTRAVAAAMLEEAGELRAGNAILNVAFTGGAALGPGIAGLVVAAFDVQTALLLDAASFYAIALILFTAGPLPQAAPDPGRVWERVRAGLSYIREQVTLRRLLVAESVAFVFFAAVIPIEVFYAKESLDAGDSGYGLFLASWGFGMVLGSIVFAAMRGTRLPLLLFFSTIVIGLGYLGMAAAPGLAVACAAAVLGGAGNGVQWVATVSAVQELTAPKMQARVMAVLESSGSAMPGIGYLLGSAATHAFEPRATFLLAGLGVVAIALIAAPILGTRWAPATIPPAGGPGGAGSGEEPQNRADDDVMVELIPAFWVVPVDSPTQSGGGK
jgi:MFS family permease